MPHQQIGVDPVPEVNEELFRIVFTLPGVENRPSTFSLPGARGLWINETIPIDRQDQIVSGREFAHIHPDGSLHASLPIDRAGEAVDAGWAEPQPIADQLGVPGLVMIHTPRPQRNWNLYSNGLWTHITSLPGPRLLQLTRVRIVHSRQIRGRNT